MAKPKNTPSEDPGTAAGGFSGDAPVDHSQIVGGHGEAAASGSVTFITIQIPILAPEIEKPGHETFKNPHIDIHLDPAQAEAIRHVACALDFNNDMRLNNGQRVKYNGDVTRYIVDQIVAAIPACNDMVTPSVPWRLAK